MVIILSTATNDTFSKTWEFTGKPL